MIDYNASPLLGYSTGIWMKMLAANGFKVAPKHLHRALGLTAFSGVNTIMTLAEKAFFSRAVKKVKIESPPLFIIGHWRCGTTYLHELLTQDPAHTYPNTYECFAPTHFVFTEGWGDKLFSFVLPDQRPMDNVKVGFNRPQEDEFALCASGLASPYRMLAFPEDPKQFSDFLDLDNMAPGLVEDWKDGLHRFFQRITYRRPGRLIVKTPGHSFRIRQLLELYPDARFIHIVRDPYRVFPSTVHLWKRLIEEWTFQNTDFEGLEELVLDVYVKLYAKLDETRSLIDDSRYFEVNYEELTADPLPLLKQAYAHLDLGDFDVAKPHVESFLQTVADYRTNCFPPDSLKDSRVTERWGHIVDRYGY